MVRDVVRDCLEKEPSDRTESDIRESQISLFGFKFFLLKILFVKYQVSLNHFFTEALLDFMQHLPVSFYLVD